MQSKRLYFLDWIRIAAFFLLIVYHVGMYYVTWDWHVKSPNASDAIEPLMLLSSPWRMCLLFLVSGVAASFMLDKLGAAKFAKQRSFRLLVPLIFGMFVIVPPQAYFQVVEHLGFSGDYAEFMKLYIGGYHGFCDKNGCLTLPTWNHLWFLPYLWAYTMILAVIGSRGVVNRAGAALAQALTGWRIIVLPAALFAVYRIVLLPHFPTTHDLVHDWHMHATYLSLFLAGALLAKQPQFWENTEKARFAALGLALGCWACLISYYSLPEEMQTILNVQRVVYALCQWSAIIAVCGFARRHLNFDSPKRQYLTEAVFPVYILHQTLIVCFAHGLKAAHIAPATEGLVLVVLTVTASFGIFEIVRRVPLLRPFFGLLHGKDPLLLTQQPQSSTEFHIR
jgi:surface polysaccharide O-acyltransferase-like enzyme